MEAVPINRVLFWAFYIFGVLVFIFGLLLAQVPRTDFRLDLAIGAGCSALLLISLWLVRKILVATAVNREATPTRMYRLFAILALAQLLFCVYALVSLLV